MPDIILPYEPIVITDTTDLPRDEWLAYRKTGIGGSDVAAILGISPFGTARDIYYDKLSIASFYDDEANKYQKKIGTLLEDVVAEMFAEVTGYRVFKIRKMFRSREHSFMLADVDFFVQLPDGSFAILECKTTSPDATEKWWDGDKPTVPLNYQLQGRHYMPVMHINKMFYACLHGNSENYLIVRELDRDLEYSPVFAGAGISCWRREPVQGTTLWSLRPKRSCSTTTRSICCPGAKHFTGVTGKQGISVKSTTPFTEPPFQPTATVTICSPPHICRKRLLFSVWASGHRTSITQMNWTNF